MTTPQITNTKHRYVYALYHVPSKSYVMDSGYYGNAHSIQAYDSKEACEKHIVVYYRNKGYKAKRMGVK